MKAIFLALFGLFAGAYGCLIGAGGGFILMPILLMVHPNEPASVLTATSLIAIFMNSLYGSIAYVRMGRVNYKCAAMLIMGIAPGSIAGVALARVVPRGFFDVLFGSMLMLLAGCLALKAPAVHESTSENHFANSAMDKAAIARGNYASHNLKVNISIAMLLGCLIACISNLAGVGGGIILVPALVELLKMPVRIATATSMLVLCVNSLIGSAAHFVFGTAFNAAESIIIGVGMMAGAQIGVMLSGRISSRWIMRLLAIALGIVGVRVLLSSI